MSNTIAIIIVFLFMVVPLCLLFYSVIKREASVLSLPYVEEEEEDESYESLFCDECGRHMDGDSFCEHCRYMASLD